MKVALHTKVRADRVEEYETAYQDVPEEPTAAIRAAGVGELTIWRSGTDLFHVLEAEDYQAMIAELDKPPVNIAWQARTADLLDVVHDHSAQGADASLPVVWEL
ncbi:L-rhamnose mutarotase [Streptomyces sp. NPDC086519]|uniref:L-rhamnose mutarotase n=1 Tax=Streptomyces sp. NPDC086519 TaxID=3154863 RepID=UPI00343331A6